MITRRPAPRPFNVRRPEIIGMMGAYQAPPAPIAGDPEPVAAPGDRPQPAAPSARPAPRRSSFLDSRGFRVFDRVLGGQTITEARDAEDARDTSLADRQRREAFAAEQDMDAVERELFLEHPETWAKLMLSGRETRVVSPGSMVGDASGVNWAAPRVGMDGGVPYSIDPMDGSATYGDARPLGPNETARQEIDRARLAETERHNRASEGVASARESRIAGGAAPSRRVRPAASPRAATPPWQRSW